MPASIRISPEELRDSAERMSRTSEMIIQGYYDMMEHADRLSETLGDRDYSEKIMHLRSALSQGLDLFRATASEIYQMEKSIAWATTEMVYGTPDMMTGNFKFEG